MASPKAGSAPIPPPRGEAGIAALEFGLMAPLLVLMLVAATELGSSIYQGMQAQNAAEAGAVYASKHGFNAAGISAAVASATTAAGITATPAPSQFCGCPVASGITEMACTATCADGTAPGQYMRVSAQLTRTPLISLSGLVIPGTLTGQAIVRAY